jgi:hypothetical protein
MAVIGFGALLELLPDSVWKHDAARLYAEPDEQLLVLSWMFSSGLIQPCEIKNIVAPLLKTEGHSDPAWFLSGMKSAALETCRVVTNFSGFDPDRIRGTRDLERRGPPLAAGHCRRSPGFVPRHVVPAGAGHYQLGLRPQDHTAGVGVGVPGGGVGRGGDQDQRHSTHHMRVLPRSHPRLPGCPRKRGTFGGYQLVRATGRGVYTRQNEFQYQVATRTTGSSVLQLLVPARGRWRSRARRAGFLFGRRPRLARSSPRHRYAPL